MPILIGLSGQAALELLLTVVGICVRLSCWKGGREYWAGADADA
jgi:hypothetical protein